MLSSPHWSSVADSDHSYTSCNSLDSTHVCSKSRDDQLITENMQKMSVGEWILFSGNSKRGPGCNIHFHPFIDCVKQDKSHYNGGKEKLERALQYIRRQRYDVFLSFAQEDEEFAEEVRQRLINQANLRVFVPGEGQFAKSCY